MNENTSVELAGADRLNLPSAEVTVPLCAPLIWMDTPGSAKPCLSFTLPFIVISCAIAIEKPYSRKTTYSIIFFVIIALCSL